MVNEILNLWIKHKTKNLTEIPLFFVTFDYQKYIKNGKKDSCMIHAHPEITKDAFVREHLQEVVDYIRDNYDLDIFTRI